MKKLALALLLLIPASQPLLAAEKLSAPELIALAKAKSPKLRDAINTSFDEKAIKDGTAWSSQGPDFFFAMQSATPPKLVIDDRPGMPMHPITGPGSSNGSDARLWYTSAHIAETGKNHAFHYLIDGKDFGGRLDLPAFGPLSYLLPDTPTGKLSEKITHTSKIYEGMTSNYWIYVPAQYDPKTPAALMVFQDGEGYTRRNSEPFVLNVIDNLIAQKKIPVIICVFINPGDVTNAPGTPTYDLIKSHADRFKRTIPDATRSTLYDTVSDRYDRYLRDEILADVGKQYNLRPDAYSRAITGLSSGGICAFNAAWQMPGGVAQFSRVISWIGSFTSIQWMEREDVRDGGQDFPDKVLREPHRNLRVWLQDGANDMENPNFGSWPMANIRMANALKTREYDFHFSFGKGTHNTGQGAAEFPEEMTWLWRGYDSAKIEETYQQEPEEKAKPFFRVAITNRTAD
jgi:enterochelin esterase family protein